MAKLSPEDQATLDRLTALRDAPDTDTDDEIWVRNSQGHETRLTGERARAWLRRNGYHEDDGDQSSRSEPLDPAGSSGPAGSSSTPARSGVRKGGKPKVAAGAGAGAVEPDGEELEQDAPAPTGRRAFF